MQFFIDHSMYAALVVALIVLVGILFYLVRLDSRIRSIEAGLARTEAATSDAK